MTNIDGAYSKSLKLSAKTSLISNHYDYEKHYYSKSRLHLNGGCLRHFN